MKTFENRENDFHLSGGNLKSLVGGVDLFGHGFSFGLEAGIMGKAIRMPDLDQIPIGLLEFGGAGGGG